MTTLVHRRYSSHVLARVIDEAPTHAPTLTDAHRKNLSARFRAVPAAAHRTIDAWTVERGGHTSSDFRWTPSAARRTIGNAAARRVLAAPTRATHDAVRDEIDELLARAATGYARPGSLASWLAECAPAVLSLVLSDATNWTTQLLEASHGLSGPFEIARADAYYDVARARTTLRGRRDLIVATESSRVLLRVRAGAPGKSAGPGLRADLTVDALADVEGHAAARIVGLWPDAGVLLCVDATMEDLRAGARDLVRAAVATRRHQLRRAA